MKLDFHNLPVIYLHPGEVCFSSKDVVVSTVLGSCISITMNSNGIPYGSISHCQLPSCRKSLNGCLGCSEPYKYVDCTIAKMLKKFNDKGITNSEIEIKLFGGADVLQTIAGKTRINTIGSQNINSAIKSISENNLKIAVSDVGGERGRKIFYRPKTGEVFLNRLGNNENN